MLAYITTTSVCSVLRPTVPSTLTYRIHVEVSQLFVGSLDVFRSLEFVCTCKVRIGAKLVAQILETDTLVLGLGFQEGFSVTLELDAAEFNEVVA